MVGINLSRIIRRKKANMQQIHASCYMSKMKFRYTIFILKMYNFDFESFMENAEYKFMKRLI